MEKGLRLHFYAEPSFDKRLYGDPYRLRQILVNLLSNAVKFTNSGMVKILAVIKEKRENDVTMYFEIKDSGIGIEKDKLDMIFEAFTQVEENTTKTVGGSGLGLSITMSLINMMGGKLSVESIPGVGSKFSFDLVFKAELNEITETSPENFVFDEQEKPEFEGEILLCEDNPMNQQVICDHLARIGLKIEVAENGREGLNRVKERIQVGKKQFDLIFMDIHMPEMDGIEATQRILKLDQKIPIVALTANVMTTDRELYLQLGMNECLGKPFKTRELWQCLMRYLTPITWKKTDKIQSDKNDNGLHQRIINSFVKNNSNKFSEFMEALNCGDIKKAYRLAHNLKSNAGQLNKFQLQSIANEVENCLKNGVNELTEKQIVDFNTELNVVLNDLQPLVVEGRYIEKDTIIDTQKLKNFLSRLGVLLEEGNPDCLSMINELRKIPESYELAKQIEELEFEKALELFKDLKKKVLI